MLIALRVVFGLLCLIALIGSMSVLVQGAVSLQAPGMPVSNNLDNVMRYLAGQYLGVSLICLWMAVTMEQQSTLIYLVALAVFLGAASRLVSAWRAGPPDRRFYGFLAIELTFAPLVVLLQWFREV
jgi:Domain of unknown function (DUF4345)